MTAPKAIGLECEACHDTSFANPLDHKTDGSAGAGPPPANVNSQFWFGKTETADTGRNVNTAHLGAAYFPTGFPAGNPTNKYEYALAFDRKCGNPATGCHRSAVHNQHPVKPPSPQPADNVLTFGQGGTVPNPKAYWWYPAITDYVTQFYQSRSPWDVNDVTTRAAGTFPDNGVTYGLCVSCHDPHGTNAPVNLLGATTNYMLRGDTRPPNAGLFCNTACHTSRTPP
jgi:predicted CXXCH cytochrome family protein